MMRVYLVTVKFKKAADKCNKAHAATWNTEVHSKTPLVAKAIGIEQFRASEHYKNCLGENSVRVKFIREY